MAVHYSLIWSVSEQTLKEHTLPAGPRSALCMQLVPVLRVSLGHRSKDKSVLLSLCLCPSAQHSTWPVSGEQMNQVPEDRHDSGEECH